MQLLPTRTVVSVAIALSAANLALMAGQVSGFVHLPALSGFNEPFDNSQISAGGEPGSSGPEGSTDPVVVTGPMGPAGPAGPRGIQGKTGPQGPQGIQGIAGKQGPVGETGAAGVPGLPGAAGVAGPQGPVGPAGPQGPQGIQGIAGVIGPKGDTGDTGPMGPSGVIAANSPLVYDADSKTISLDQSQISQVGTLDYLQFSLLNSATDAPGRLRWNEEDGTLSLQGRDGNVTLQLGQETVQMVKNLTASTIPNGSVVRVDGSSNGRISVVLADNSTALGASAVIGVATQDILAGGEGYVTTYGLVRDINTSAWAAGSAIYLNANGLLTDVRPINGRIVQLGFVVTSDATAGTVYVNPIHNFEPIIGGICVVPGQTGTGIFAWHNLAGARWIVVCDY